MKQYLDLLRHIKENGVQKGDRTGTGTISVFGYQMRFDLQKGFPLLTTKKLHLKSIIHELLWFLKGDTNIKYLNDNGVTIWDEWADENGDLGPIYSKAWRSWGNFVLVPAHDEGTELVPEQYVNKPIDQISWLMNRIKTHPDCRRLIVSAWNVADIPKAKLPPCHILFQFWTRIRPDGRRGISCQLYQRSADTPLGVGFNIASYALFLMMIAQCCDMVAEEFIWTGGDTHIYLNQMDGVNEQLTREPYTLPTMRINPEVKDIFSFKYEDFQLQNYKSHPSIKMPVSV